MLRKSKETFQIVSSTFIFEYLILYPVVKVISHVIKVIQSLPVYIIIITR